jgi:hypothetical protein
MYPYKNIENENYMRVMDNLYSASLEARYKNDSPYLDGPGEDYYLFFNRIKTPYKAVGSFAFVIGNMGLVSMDCEYVDYSRIKLKGSEPTDWFNTEIKKYFKSTVNLRFGAELWVKNLALRIGYMQNQSPDKDYDMSRKTYSAGFGYKLSRRFNIDFAYVQTNTTDHYTHYENANKIIENLKNRRLSITLGWILDYSSFY